jgi:hypothetical protein
MSTTLVSWGDPVLHEAQHPLFNDMKDNRTILTPRARLSRDKRDFLDHETTTHMIEIAISTFDEIFDETLEYHTYGV